MKLVGRAALVLLGGLVVLIAVVAVRTATYSPPAAQASQTRLAAPVTIDTAAAARRLSQAIGFQTVSHQDQAEDTPAEWDRLHAWLQTSYPAAHAVMRREVLAGHTLVYTWPGSDPALKPIVLMAHQDVVPVTPGTEKDWKHPPFAGVIADGAVWGRGAIDDKGSLVTLFEGMEALAKAGFKPRRMVIVVSGHDEEVRGLGAQAAAAHLKAQGIQAEFVLDEGLAIVQDHPLTGGPVAMIGLGEKGYATMTVTATAPGGHSSTPPKDTGTVTLSRALVAIAEHPFPMKLDGAALAMLQSLAPESGLPLRMAVANTWLFEPLIVSQIAATPAGAALLHTTIAPTMLRGSPKENVLPQDATAWINYRIAPGQTSAEVMAHTKAAVGDLPVTLAWVKTPAEPSPLSSTTSRGYGVLSTLVGDMAKGPVAPGLVTAGTDSRYLAPVADDIYRFQPMRFTLAETAMIHGANERLTLDNLELAVQFYARLIATAAAS